MRQFPSDVAFTPAVKNIQTAKGSRASYAKVERRGWRTQVTPDLTEFLAGLDMFYLGTANFEGQPYILCIQHRADSVIQGGTLDGRKVEDKPIWPE